MEVMRAGAQSKRSIGTKLESGKCQGEGDGGHNALAKKLRTRVDREGEVSVPRSHAPHS